MDVYNFINLTEFVFLEPMSYQNGRTRASREKLIKGMPSSQIIASLIASSSCKHTFRSWIFTFHHVVLSRF